jgi:hypothetical protein
MEKRKYNVVYRYIGNGEDRLPSVKESTKKIRDRYEKLIQRKINRQSKIERD